MTEGVTLRVRIAVAVATTIVISGCATNVTAATGVRDAPRKTLQAFSNDQEISDLFGRWAEQRRRDEAVRRKENAVSSPPTATMGSLSVMPAAPALASAAKAADQTASHATESITNVQHTGVDEGGIVKRHGDHLVILRRGRLFTVKIGDNDLSPVSVADAFGEGLDPRGAWYDEMLISGDTVAVIGYSYQRGGTEIGLFAISPDGKLDYKSTHHLRSNDYYSSRNYASRLIGSKLVFYTPLYLNPWGGDPFATFPAVRRWHPAATAAEFKRIAPATRIYRTDEDLDPNGGVALHSVTVCELAKAELDCKSTAVVGAPGRVFYVSSSSVYVWTTPMRRSAPVSTPDASVFRIPLDGAAPTALKASGSPIDQFSFLEGEDRFLNVLVRAHGRGDAMGSAEFNAGDYALLRVSLDSFADGRDAAPARAYKRLARPEGNAIQSRYVGPYLLYGAGAGWNRPQRTLHSHVYAVRYASDDKPIEIPLAHGVDRIEALGGNAVVIGSDGRDLHFTSLRLARVPVAQDRYIRQDAGQGETRSHGFFYKQEGDESGVVGLPIVGGARAAAGQLRQESAAVLFLRNQSLRLSEIGALDSRAAAGGNDGCRASCVDWYGNSRPIFVGNRVFALMGYEIVEGADRTGRLVETRRINILPTAFSVAR